MNDVMGELAKAGVGYFMAASASGTLGSTDPDAVHEMADAMSSSPDETARALGQNPDLAGSVSPEALRTNILREYYDARFADMFANDKASRDEAAAAMIDRRHQTEYTYARLTPEEIGRVEFDAENGDESALLKVKEQFYLG